MSFLPYLKMINLVEALYKNFCFLLAFLNWAFCCSFADKNLYLQHEFGIVLHSIKSVPSFIIVSVKSVFTQLNFTACAYYFQIPIICENPKFVYYTRSTRQLLWYLAIVKILKENFWKLDVQGNIDLLFTHASLFSCCELTGLLYFYFRERKILKDHYIVVYFDFNFQFYALSVFYGFLLETNPFCK